MCAKRTAQDALYPRVKVIANPSRFRILALTQHDALSVRELSKRLALSYTKTADYATLLARYGLVRKTRRGKETLVRSTTTLGEHTITFPTRKSVSHLRESPVKRL